MRWKPSQICPLFLRLWMTPLPALLRRRAKRFYKMKYRAAPEGLPFFTDASALQPYFQCPTIILGPGELSTMHQTDEYCRVDRIEQAVKIYGNILQNWCLGNKHEI